MHNGPLALASLTEELACAVRRAPEPGVVAVYLFGSHSRGRAHRESDVDVAVLLRHEARSSRRERFALRLRLAAAIAGALRRNDIDVVVVNDAPPELARAIVTQGRRVLCVDFRAERDFVRDVQLRAADLGPFLRRTRAVKLASLGR